METARAIGSGRIGSRVIQQQPQQPFVNNSEEANLNDSAPYYTPNEFEQLQQQQGIEAPKQTSNIVNGIPFKLPSVQDRLKKNRIYFDEKLKNQSSTE